MVATLPITGGRLDKTAEQENAAIGSSIPTLRNKIDGDDTIATPPPLKEISASTIGVKEMKEPNEAQKAASGMQKDVKHTSTKTKSSSRTIHNFKINPVKMDVTTSLKTKLSGNIGVDTSLPSELQDYANANVEAQVRQGADKELQPLLTKSLGKVQGDVQKQEELRDKKREEELQLAQTKAKKEENKARKEQSSILEKPKQEAEKAKTDADSQLKVNLTSLKNKVVQKQNLQRRKENNDYPRIKRKQIKSFKKQKRRQKQKRERQIKRRRRKRRKRRRRKVVGLRSCSRNSSRRLKKPSRRFSLG